MTTLDLSLNNIGPEGAKAFADALRVSEALSNLDISTNNIGPEGAKAFADALRVTEAMSSVECANGRTERARRVASAR